MMKFIMHTIGLTEGMPRAGVENKGRNSYSIKVFSFDICWVYGNRLHRE